MANSYIELMKIVNQGNKMGLSNTITRDNGIPLDLSSVQESYEAAVIYAATKAIAYQGQLLAAEGVVYVIVADSQGEYEASDGTKYQNYLKPVGTAPKGDDASISVTADGLVSLYGFANAENGKLPMKVDGAIVWKSLEDIGAGDGNDDTTYTFELNAAKNGIIVTPLFNGQPIMEGEGDAQTQKKFEIVLDVYTKAEADEKFLAKADYTPYDDTELEGRVKAIEDDYLKAADKYDDTDVKARLDVIEGDYLKAADKYDDTELAGRVTTIENDYLKAADKYDDTDVKSRLDAIEADYLKEEDKYDDTALAGRVSTLETTSADHETRIGKVEDFFKTADGESLSEAMDTLIEIQKEIASDNEGAAAMLADIQANTTAIATLNGDATTDGSVDKKIADAVAPLATTEALNGVKATADAAAVKADVEADLAKKVDVETYNTDKATFAVKDDVDGALALKADADKVVDNDTFAQFQTDNAQAIADARSGAVADVEAKGYAVADEVAQTYATKSDLEDHSNTMATTLNDYAKKADVNAELAKKIETGSVAHSTDELTEGVTVTGTNLNIVVDTFTKAETRQYVADTIKTMTGGESAADVKLLLENHIDAYEEKVGQIDTKNGEQDTAIAAAQTQADKGVADAKTANDAIAALTNGQVATNSTDINAIKGRLDTLETAKGDHASRLSLAEGDIKSLQAADVTINEAIGAIQGKITDLTNEDARLAGLIQSNTDKFAGYYTKSEVDSKVQEAIDAIPDVDFTPYATNEYVNAELAKKANAGDSYTKAEADGKFMTEGQVDDRLNALINAADPDGGKTITDIQNLVKYVDENAGEIASLITATGNNTAKLAGIETTVVDYVAGQLATIVQPKASAEVTVGEDGTLGLGQVSTDKLVNGVDTLVINGGSAI